MSGMPPITMTSNGYSDIVQVNPISSYSPYLGTTPSWALGLILTITDGASLTATVQVTGDQQPSDDGFWNNHDEIVNVTSSVNSNVAFPITALRLYITNYVSGTCNLAVVTWP